ncbi:Methylated-DNA--protein-cysteine methyltransferase, inducible [Companilactobacillus paralimentarius]|uniref:methylated-DNA--[protein]-cysteine S-methyltransferase n=2 Tax=Companilactobacillus nantensis TaxID=305793 RepID=A0A0R1WL31_9LACO|nr:methylated DNA-protein cysteine methyltransferase [Companilactobacillus nantensis DSM 16982]GEO63289.1 methylated-DNA--[protein]-cysteine S-methyltransferase [Companilactobacillus nantensis]
MKKIYYYIFKIERHTYLIGATANGLAFVGSRDQGLAELQQFYDCPLIENEDKAAPYLDQIKEYLAGQRKTFTLKTDITGTEFQESVWRALLQIPYGAVTDYTSIAEKIGRPKASRAVGSAVGKNPLLMVIPCHRVLTKAGKLGGYRGGVAMKEALLTLEQAS